jgi:hypothetical protein
MKNFLAVVAGLAFTILVAVGMDNVMHRTGVFSLEATDMTTSGWLVAMSYRLAAAVAGGWITARLAASRPMFLATLLGVFGTVIGLAGLFVVWQARPALGPVWYPLALVLTAVPCTWLGGRLAKRADG